MYPMACCRIKSVITTLNASEAILLDGVTASKGILWLHLVAPCMRAKNTKH